MAEKKVIIRQPFMRGGKIPVSLIRSAINGISDSRKAKHRKSGSGKAPAGRHQANGREKMTSGLPEPTYGSGGLGDRDKT